MFIVAFIHRNVLRWQVGRGSLKVVFLKAWFYLFFVSTTIPANAEALSRLEVHRWINGCLFASPVKVWFFFFFLFRISSECPASDYGCSSPTIHPGGQTSGLHASINSDFSAAFVPRHPRRSASSHCHHGASGDLLCKLCKRIHPHEPGHSRRSSWSCRSSVGLSWWPPR